MNTVDDYMSAPYSFRIFFERPPGEDGAWVAEVVEIPSCASSGDTPEAALAMVREGMQALIRSRIERGIAVPPPASVAQSA